MQTLVDAFGGWEVAIEAVTTAMLVLLAIRFFAFIGNVIMMLGRAAAAFRLMGEAGFLAQLEVAAVPIAIGAAFVALILIIEDVVAYFQGRKSITGVILNNFDGLAQKLFDQFDVITQKAAGFAKKIAEAITNAILDIDEDKIKKIGDVIFKVLSLALITGGLALQLGMAIGGAIVDGIAAAMEKKAPFLYKLIFGGADTAPITGATVQPDKDASGQSSIMDKIGAAFLGGGLGGGESLSGIALDALKDRSNQVDQMRAAGPGASPGAGGGSSQNIDVNAPITINVPAGTAPEDVGPMAQKGVRESLDALLRESSRATKPAVAY